MRSVYRLSLLTLVSISFITSALGVEPEGTLLERHQCRFDVVLGRIVFRTGCPAKGQHREAEEDVEETLSVTSQVDGPSLHYVRRTPRETLILDIYDGACVKLERRISRVGGESTNVALSQPLEGDLSLRLIRDHAESTYSAPSLWHLRMAEPAVFGTHLLPALELLRVQPQAGWETDPIADEMARLLSEEEKPLRHQQFRDLVNRLSHPRRAVRNAAQQQLQECGIAILAQLEELDPLSLDGEQRARLAEVAKNVKPIGGDRPARIATWLSTDLDYWQIAARQMPIKQRLAVDDRLQQAVGKGLPPHLLEMPMRFADGSSAPVQR